jgi:hypothetical protein
MYILQRMVAEVMLAVATGGTPSQAVLDFSFDPPETEIRIAYVKEGEGCMALGERLGYTIGPKGCERLVYQFNLPSYGLFSLTSFGPVKVEPILRTGDPWAVIFYGSIVTYFGPLKYMK